MKVFCVGDRIKLSDELIGYSANKHWIGKIGTVIEIIGADWCIVKWDHLEKPMRQLKDYIMYA